MRVKRLNGRLAIFLLLGIAVLVLGVYLLHEFQVRRTASSMKAVAAQAQAAGKRAEAIRQYRYYVNYAPQDYEALSQLALLVAEEADHSPSNLESQRKARDLLEQAARHDPDNAKVLGRLVDYSLRVGRYSDAMAHLNELLKAAPQDSTLWLKLAACHMALEHDREAIESLEKAIALDPSLVDAYVLLAEVHAHHPEGHAQAEATLERLIEANPQLAAAYLARGRSLLRAKKAEAARDDFQKAAALAPDDLDVLLAATEFASTSGQLDEAEQKLQRAAQLFPNDERVLRAQVDLQLRSKRPQEAVKTLEAIVNSRTEAPQERARLVELLLDTGEVAKAREQIEPLRGRGFPPALLGYFDARLAMSEGKWLAASQQLESLRPQLASQPRWATGADLALGQCYQRLGLADLQVEAFQRVLQQQPSEIRARLGHASGLLHAGKTEPALREYRQLRQALGDATFLREPVLRAELFQALLRQVQQQPADQRDWSELNQLLAAIAAVPGLDPGQLVPMQAEVLLAQNQLTQAYDLITAACQTNPKQAVLWLQRAKLAARRDGGAAGLAVLDEAATALGNPLLVRLARLDLAVQLKGPQAEELLQTVAAGVAELPEAERGALWQALGNAYQRLDHPTQARDLWRQAAQAQPENVQLRLLLLELGREMGDEAAMVDASEQIKKLLGSRSAEWNYAEALRRVWKASQESQAAALLQEATQLLTTARELRPTWPQVAHLEAEIALRQGNPDEAIRAYQRARSLGPLTPQDLQRLVTLLASRQRSEEARQLLSEFDDGTLSPELKRMRAELALHAGDRESALKMAEALVAGSSQPSDYLWYGKFLLQAQRGEEGIAALRHAVELSPKTPQERLMLIAGLIHAGKATEARAEAEALSKALPAEAVPSALAQAYHLLGDRPQAEAQYRAAVTAEPDDLDRQLQLASFYVQGAQDDRGLLPKAQEQLRTILASAGRDAAKNAELLATARRLLAVVLANSGDVRQQDEAQQLLEQNYAGHAPALADQHARAAVLGASPKRAVQTQAIALLEQLQKEASLNGDEQLRLARLYDLQGQWPTCRQTMLNLLASQPEPAYLQAFVQMLLQHEAAPEEMAPWLQKLTALRPEDPITVILQARWQTRKGDTAAAVASLETLVPPSLPEEKVGRLAEVALALEGLQQAEKARPYWEKYAERKPEGKLDLALFLGRQKEADRAWQVWQSAPASVPAGTVLAAALDLLTLEAQHGPLVPEHVAAVEASLEKLKAGSAEEQRQGEVLLSRLWELQGRAEDLVRLYQRYLERPELTDPQRAQIWNNLAFVLAVHQRQGEQAVELVNRAMGVLGPGEALLDTRAMAYLAAGKLPEALADLQESIAVSPNGLKYYHLALVQQAAGDSRAAAESLHTASEKYHLTPAQVPALEQASYQKLLQALPASQDS